MFSTCRQASLFKHLIFQAFKLMEAILVLVAMGYADMLKNTIGKAIIR